MTQDLPSAVPSECAPKSVPSDSSLSEQVASTLFKLQTCKDACPFSKFTTPEVGSAEVHHVPLCWVYTPYMALCPQEDEVVFGK